MTILEFIIDNTKFLAEKFNEKSYKILPFVEHINANIILEEFKKQLNIEGNYKIIPFENIPVFDSVAKYKQGYNVIEISE